MVTRHPASGWIGAASAPGTFPGGGAPPPTGEQDAAASATSVWRMEVQSMRTGALCEKSR